MDSVGNNFAGINDDTTLNFTTGNLQATASDDTGTTNEDNAVAIDVLANDSDTDGSLNAASVMVDSASSNGSTSINTGTGVITFTPDANFNGSDSFTYTVEDNDGLASTTATVTVTVNAQNDAPIAAADMSSTPEDNSVNIDVAANDSDIDVGDSVDSSSIVIVTTPSSGLATVTAGQINYTPDANFNGTDTFSYTIDDSTGATSNIATVTINVTGVNDLPTASDDSATVDEDTVISINVLANDSDIDGTLDTTTVVIQSNPANGSAIADASTGEVTYTPSANFNGSDTFTYTVQDDSNGTSNVATVAVSVNSINDTPTAVTDTAVLLEDAVLMINVLGNDSDLDGTLDTTSVEVVTSAVNGSTSVDAQAGTIEYTPGVDFNGSDSFTYRVADDMGALSDTATVNLTI